MSAGRVLAELGFAGQTLLLVAAFVVAGVLLRRRLRIDSTAMSRTALYVFTPGLVFHALTQRGLSLHDLTAVVVFAAGVVLAAVLLSRGVGRALHADQGAQAALDLTTAFSNSSNLGLPLVAFTLGPRSLQAAVIYVLTQIVAVNTVGAYLASRGSMDPRAAWRRVVRLPAMWAMVAAALVDLLHWPVPQGLATATTIAGNAYSPTVLVVLGATIADWRLRDIRSAVAWWSTGLRLVVMPAVAAGLAAVLPLPPAAARALVLQIATPVAINAIILSREFEAAPEQVAQTITLSTVASALTVPACLTVLGLVR
ncbi:MAG: AEC family transporter [Actinomycetia bacterium]|nr:AEC family transporter [Actinomycetes bacterium]